MTDLALISKKEAADRLAVSVTTIDRLRRTGDLDTIRVRGCVRITVDSVNDYKALGLVRDGEERRAGEPSLARKRDTSQALAESLDDLFPIEALDRRRHKAA
jgi:excisionase family DNA binding protein